MTDSENDFVVNTPSGTPINFDARIGLTKAQHGVSAFTNLVPMRLVVIDGRMRGKSMLDNYLHECAHTLFPGLTEADVVEIAAFLTDVLWKAGYRRTSEAKKNVQHKRRSNRSRHA